MEPRVVEIAPPKGWHRSEDDEADTVCSEDCDHFIEGAPPCHCYSKDGDIVRPGW